MVCSQDRNNFSRAIPRPFGLANWVTLARCLGALVFLALGAGAAGGVLAIGARPRWIIVATAMAALCLDGVDGHVARRLGQASAFGARFDMETDALQMLALSLLVWGVGQAGGWVLFSGLMRYIFILGGWLWPVLSLPLPPRQRRRSVCVAQIVVLTVALAPPVTPLWAEAICLAGLALLSYSFGRDLIWLIGRSDREREAVVEQS